MDPGWCCGRAVREHPVSGAPVRPTPAGGDCWRCSIFGATAIGVGSLGRYHLIRLHAPSVAAAVGAGHNIIAGALFTGMALVQLAVRARAPEGARDLVGDWLDLDVAWDVYIGLGTLVFAWAMRSHPRYRWAFAAPGLALGLLVIVVNLMPFPVPPAEAGSFDVGPFVGLWYLAATIQAWRSLPWARQRCRPAA